jgi:CheY-like chemotaxis protein
VAFTAYASDKDRARALDHGFDAYVRKPVEAHALVRGICVALRARG